MAKNIAAQSKLPIFERFMKLFLSILVLTTTVPIGAIAQETASKSSNEVFTVEIFLIVEDDVEVRVSVSPDPDATVPVIVDPTTIACPSRPYNWVANTDTLPPSTECTTWTDMDGDTLYELTFEVDTSPGEGFSANEIYVYSYLNCASDWDGDPFYCPNGGPEASKNDLLFTYENGEMKVYVEAYDATWGDLNEYFNDSNWLIPHHAFDAICSGGSNQSCINDAVEVSFFITPQTGPSYDLTDADIIVPSGKTWTWEDVTLEFASGTKLNVYGTFEADGVTFTASGSTWDGIYFYSGSTGDIAESVLEKANSSAALYANNVSSLTVEDSQIENTGTSAYRMAVWAFGNAGTLKLSDNTITSHDGPTILFQNSVSAYLYNNDIVMDGATDGTLYVENTAAVDFAKSTGGSGFNVVKGGPGLYADGDVVLNAGSSSGTKDYNYLCSGLDLNAHDGGVLYAHYNYWWNGSIPTPVTSGGGVVYAANSRGSSNATCTTTSALARVAEAAPSLGTRSAVALMDAAAEQPTDAEEDLFAAKALVEQQRYGEALGLFEQMEVAGAVYSGTMLLLK